MNDRRVMDRRAVKIPYCKFGNIALNLILYPGEWCSCRLSDVPTVEHRDYDEYIEACERSKIHLDDAT